MAETIARPMDEIKALFLACLDTRDPVCPIEVIDDISVEHAISRYDLKAALWYLVGDGAVRFDLRRSVIRVERAHQQNSEVTLRA